MDATGMNSRSPAVVSENDVVLKPTEKDAAMEAADVAAPAYMSMVDPFLIEALQNPRHRVTGQCSSNVEIINFYLRILPPIWVGVYVRFFNLDLELRLVFICLLDLTQHQFYFEFLIR